MAVLDLTTMLSWSPNVLAFQVCPITLATVIQSQTPSTAGRGASLIRQNGSACQVLPAAFSPYLYRVQLAYPAPTLNFSSTGVGLPFPQAAGSRLKSTAPLLLPQPFLPFIIKGGRLALIYQDWPATPVQAALLKTLSFPLSFPFSSFGLLDLPAPSPDLA